MSSPTLLGLPEELQCHILTFLPPWTLPSAALTCHHLHRLASSSLQLHQCYHDLYSACSDGLAQTIPRLLRVVRENPDAAWHIRSLEFCGTRPGWIEWIHFDNWEGEVEKKGVGFAGAEVGNAFRGGVGFWREGEFVGFAGMIREVFCLREDEVEEWSEKVREGWDEPLKGLLVALAPELRRLECKAYDPWVFPAMLDERDGQPTTFLCLAIRRVAESCPNSFWPPGFQSLRSIAIGTHQADNQNYDTYSITPATIAPLFCLPNIRILHFSQLGYSGDRELSVNDLPAASSSVDTLSLYRCDIEPEVLDRFIAAPRALREFYWTDTAYPDRIPTTGMLAARHAETLETLMFLGNVACSYYPHILKRFKRLRVLDHLPLKQMLLSTTRWPTDISFGPVGADVDCALDLRDFLPVSMEKIVLPHFRGWGEEERDEAKAETNGREQRALALRLAQLVEDPRFKRLREICLCAVSRVSARKALRGMGRPVQWDKEALERIQAKGVKTYCGEEEDEEHGEFCGVDWHCGGI